MGDRRAGQLGAPAPVVAGRERKASPRARRAQRHGPEDHFRTYGPGAVGVGWDLTLAWLARHLAAPQITLDPAESEAWTMSDEGKMFVRESGEAWGHAHVATGEDPDEAHSMAARTIAFYTGAS